MKMKKSSESSVWYVVLIVAVLNVVAFVSEKNWHALIFFALATGATYAIKPDKVLALVTGVIVSNVFKATVGVHEGYASRGKPEEPDASNAKDDNPLSLDNDESTPKPAPSKKKKEVDPLDSALEGTSLDGLMKRQTELMTNLKTMQPLILQAKSMMKAIPPGMMKKAMEGFMKK
jgi:hypothetical protein